MYSEFEKKINYVFKDKRLLNIAFTHSSFSNENNLDGNNERLEFLGDAVLELTVSDFLYKKFQYMSEGDLTKLRASIVCEQSLSKIARNINIGKYLKLGNGEEMTGGRERDSILSDALEAIIGAVYLDSSIEYAKKLIISFIPKEIESKQEKLLVNDYKSRLQEILQKNSKEPIVYDIIKEIGPDHNKLFTAQVRHHRKILGTGEGKTKKEAEQNAALSAMNKSNLL